MTNRYLSEADKVIVSLAGFNDPIYEAGGFLLYKNNEYIFIGVPNKHHGTPTGVALYEPEDYVYASMLGPYFRNGWDLYASFHTHPQFTSQYSGIDYKHLFANHNINYIKSIKYGDIRKYKWLDENTLQGEQVQ